MLGEVTIRAARVPAWTFKETFHHGCYGHDRRDPLSCRSERGGPKPLRAILPAAPRCRAGQVLRRLREVRPGAAAAGAGALPQPPGAGRGAEPRRPAAAGLG